MISIFIRNNSLPFIASGPQCAWLTSTDGVGDDETSIGFLTENECAKQCAARKVSDQRINGATIRKSDGKCWCEIGMKKQTSDSTYNSCFLPGKDMNVVERSRSIYVR